MIKEYRNDFTSTFLKWCFCIYVTCWLHWRNCKVHECLNFTVACSSCILVFKHLSRSRQPYCWGCPYVNDVTMWCDMTWWCSELMWQHDLVAWCDNVMWWCDKKSWHDVKWCCDMTLWLDVMWHGDVKW